MQSKVNAQLLGLAEHEPSYVTSGLDQSGYLLQSALIGCGSGYPFFVCTKKGTCKGISESPHKS